MRKIIKRSLLTALGVAAMAGLSAAPANAAGHDVYVAYSYPADDSNCESGGAIGFASYGDDISVSDTCADGHSAIGVVNVGSSFYYYWNHDGAGSTREVNLNFREGQPLAIRSCLGEWKGTATGGIMWSTCGHINANVTA